MFPQHFGLREDPFGVTPDARFLYLSEQHREALATIERGIEANHGFLALIAPPGLGKTTLLYHLLERFRKSRRANTAFVFQTQCDSRELIRHVTSDLGVEIDDLDMVQIHQRFNEFLAREAKLRRSVVVFIDEAQNLTEDALETVRLLSNFETSKAKLLQVVLIGQCGLASMLESEKLLQFRQRLFATVTLAPFNAADAEAYINHRLSVAGYSGKGLFSPNAVAMIVGHAEGIPRKINAVCYTALTLAHQRLLDRIDESIVREVTENLISSDLSAVPRRKQSSTPNGGREDASVGDYFSVERPLMPSTSEVTFGQASASPKASTFELTPWEVVSAPSGTAAGSATNSPEEVNPITLRPVVRYERPVEREETPIEHLRACVTSPAAAQARAEENNTRITRLVIAVAVLMVALPASALLGWELWQFRDHANRAQQTEFAKPSETPPHTPEKKVRKHPGKEAKAVQKRISLPGSEGAAPDGSFTGSGDSSQVASSVLPSLDAPTRDNIAATLPVVEARCQLSPLVSRLPSAISGALLYSQTPEYPPDAIAARLQGTVILKAVIGSDGELKGPRLISGPPLLAQSAMRTVLNWRYKPASLNGKPIESETRIIVTFSLASPS